MMLTRDAQPMSRWLKPVHFLLKGWLTAVTPDALFAWHEHLSSIHAKDTTAYLTQLREIGILNGVLPAGADANEEAW